MYKIKFTGERVTEESAEQGDFAEAGWIDPQFSFKVVHEEAEDVPTFFAETFDEAAELIENYIGMTETDGGGSFYAVDSKLDYETGDTWSYAAHVEEI